MDPCSCSHLVLTSRVNLGENEVGAGHQLSLTAVSELCPLLSNVFVFLFQAEVVKDDVFWGCSHRRILERLRLDGRVAYVTGGGQGIGRAFAHALGEAGAKVAVVDLVLAKAEGVACELSLKGKH